MNISGQFMKSDLVKWWCHVPSKFDRHKYISQLVCGKASYATIAKWKPMNSFILFSSVYLAKKHIN